MAALWRSSYAWGQVKAVFPSLLGAFSLRLRRRDNAPVSTYSAPSPLGNFRTFPMPFFFREFPPDGCQVVKRMEMKSAYPDMTVQKIGEPFSSYYRRLPQAPADMPKHLWIPIRLSFSGELFSSRYRFLPQTRADVLMHLCPPIQLPRRVKGCFPPIIESSLSQGCPDMRLHPELHIQPF